MFALGRKGAAANLRCLCAIDSVTLRQNEEEEKKGF